MKRYILLGLVLLFILVVSAVDITSPGSVTVTQDPYFDSVTISWSVTADHTYDLYATNNTDNTPALVATSISNPYTYFAVQQGVSYTFIVEANNGTQRLNSTPSAAITANNAPTISSTTLTPSSPTVSDLLVCTSVLSDTYVPGAVQANITIAYTGGSSTQTNVACVSTGSNGYECTQSFNTSGFTDYQRGDIASCSVSISDGQYSAQASSSNVTIGSEAPTVDTISITNITSSTLYCNYTASDPDGDTINESLTEFSWYINNEGDNNFLEILGQTAQSLAAPIFDQNDRIICSVRTQDIFGTQSDWENSTIYTYTENSVPQLTFINDTTTNETPASVGDDITFTATWFDVQDQPEQAQLYVCNGILPEEDQFNNGNATVQIGYTNDTSALWVYSTEQGSYVEKIEIQPFKFTENGFDYFGVDSNPQAGDFDYGLSLNDNWTNIMFYDEDSSGHYDEGEAIVRDADAPYGTYGAGTADTVISGSLPNNQLLTNFSVNSHTFYDVQSDGFSTDDYIYYSTPSTTVGNSHERAITITNASSARDFTQNIYDIYVYEVNNTADLSGILIAQDNDNNFQLNTVNSYSLQYNAKPFPDKLLAFKMCIDQDNDGTCETSSTNTGVGIRASTSGTFLTLSQNSTFYDANINLVYGTLNGSQDDGCDAATFCSTTLSSSSTLQCSYTTQESDDAESDYYAKVCDDGGACSIYRQDTFYVNHVPSVSDVQIFEYNATQELETIVSNIASVDDNLFCNYTFFDQDNQSGWLAESNVSIVWYRNDSSTDGFEACDDFENPNCPSGSSSVLTNPLTMLNDQWLCQVTPQDAFSSGTPVNSSVITVGISDASPGTTPVVSSLQDTSTSVYPGDRFVVNISYKDIDSPKVRAYICNGTTTNESDFIARAAGCLGTELYRNITDTNTQMSEFVVHEAIFSIPLTFSGNYNYTAVICDEDQQCSNATDTSAQGNFTVIPLPTVNSVFLNTTTGTISNNIVNDSTNLVCNYNITFDSEIYVNNYTGNLSYLWQYDVSGDYVNESGLSNDTQILSNTRTSLGDQWRCGINLGLGTQNFSTSVAIVDPSEENAAPQLISVSINGGSQAATNVGDNIEFRIAWNDSDDSVALLYVCEQGDIANSGCLERQLTSQFLSSDIQTFQYTAQQDDNFNQLLSLRVCDYSYNCSNTINASMFVNHNPTVQNVAITQLEGPDNFLRCDYEYDTTLDGNDEQSTTITWYLNNSIVQQSTDRTYEMTGSGLVYCTALTNDIFGSSDTQARESSNAVFVSSLTETLNIWNTYSYTNQSIYSLYGATGYNFSNITAFVYNDTDRFTFTSNSTVTTIATNLLGQTTVEIDRESGQTLLAVPIEDSYLFNETVFLSFAGHETTYLLNYAATQNSSNSNQLIINITPALEQNISSTEVISVYNSNMPQGWFNLSLTLFEGRNVVEVYTEQNEGTSPIQTIFNPLVLDTIIPTAQLNATTISPSGTLEVNVSDETALNTSININIQGNGVDDNYTVCSGNATNQSCIITPNLDVGIYNVTVLVYDLAYNFINTTQNITVSSSTPTIASVSVTDNYTQQSSIRSESINVSWIADAFSDGLRTFNVVLQNSQTLQTIENITINATQNWTILNTNLENGTTYRVGVRATSNASITGEYRYTSGFVYLFPPMPLFGINSISGSVVGATVDGTSYVVSTLDNQTAILQVSAKQNLTCYATESNVDFNVAESNHVFSLNSTTQNNISGIVDISEEGLYSYYVVCKDDSFNFEQPAALAQLVQWYIDPNAPDVSIGIGNATTQSNDFSIPITIQDNGTGINTSSYTLGTLNNMTQFTGNLSSSSTINVTPFGSTMRLVINTTDNVGNARFQEYLFYNTSSPGLQYNVTSYTNEVVSVILDLTQFANASVQLFDQTTLINSSYVVNAQNKGYSQYNVSFNASGYAQKSYGIRIHVNNTLGESQDVQEVVVLDNTAPSFANVTNTSGITFLSTTQPIINISGVSDNTIIDRVVLEHNGTGTFQNYTATGGPVNYQYQIPSLPKDTVVAWRYYVVDRAGNTISSSEQNFTVTNRDPEQSQALPSFVWAKSETLYTYDISSLFSDPDSDQLSFSSNISEVTFIGGSGVFGISGNVGNYTVNVTVSDPYGGSVSGNLSIEFVFPNSGYCDTDAIRVGFSDFCTTTVVSTPSSSGGGGGGGGGGFSGFTPSTALTYAHSYALITPTLPASLSINNVNIPVTGLTVQVNEQVNNVVFRITSLDEGPSSTYTVLEYFEIEHENLVNAQIESARITFALNETRVFDPQRVILLRLVNGNWQEIPTTFLRSQENKLYFVGNSPGLSTFAIALRNTQTSTPVPLPSGDFEPVIRETCFDGILNQNEEQVDCGGNCASCNPIEPRQEQPITQPQQSTSWLVWIVVAIAVVALLGGGYALTRTHTKHEIRPDMSSLEQYIRRHLNKDIDQEHIKQALLDAGWPEELVNEELAKIGVTQSSEPEAIPPIQDKELEALSTELDLEPTQQPEKTYQLDNDEVNNNIQDYAASLFFEGKSELEIVDQLKNQGWSEQTVTAAQTYVQAIINLKQTVAQWKAAGYSSEKIRSHLLDQGWSVYIVYEVLK